MRKLSLIKFTTNMIWFERFVRGVEIWVVRNSRPDQAIIVEVMNILRAIPGFYFPSPLPLAHFIVSWLLHPRLCDWTSFDVASISTVINHLPIVASYPTLDIAFLLCRHLYCWTSPPPFFSLLRCRLCTRLTITPVLLSPSPTLEYLIGIHCQPIALPSPPSQ